MQMWCEPASSSRVTHLPLRVKPVSAIPAPAQRAQKAAGPAAREMIDLKLNEIHNSVKSQERTRAWLQRGALHVQVSVGSRMDRHKRSERHEKANDDERAHLHRVQQECFVCV